MVKRLFLRVKHNTTIFILTVLHMKTVICSHVIFPFYVECCNVMACQKKSNLNVQPLLNL